MEGVKSSFLLFGVMVLFASSAMSLQNLCRPTNIAFEAHLIDREGLIEAGTPIIFPVEILNEGNGYDNDTGIFTAPISGVYMFNTLICNKEANAIVTSIMKGDDILLTSTVQENQMSTCGSANTIARLQAGDKVNVVSGTFQNSQMRSANWRMNSFSGLFLFE